MRTRSAGKIRGNDDSSSKNRQIVVPSFQKIRIRKKMRIEKEKTENLVAKRMQNIIKEKMDDVVMEILFRLPVKSLAVSKCVSKKWNHFISHDSYFREKYRDIGGSPLMMGLFRQRFYTRLSFIDPEIQFMCTSNQGKMLLDKNDTKFYKSFGLKGGYNYRNLYLVASANGFLLFETLDRFDIFTYFICNPITMEWFTLPTPKKTSNKFDTLFSCQVDGNNNPHYKVVRAFRQEDSRVPANLKIELFDSDQMHEWKEFNVTCATSRLVLEMKSCGVITEDGVCFMMIVDNSRKRAIVVFDYRKNPFQLEMIALPEEATNFLSETDDLGPYSHYLGQNNGALLFAAFFCQRVNMWMLDENMEEWSLIYRVNTVDMKIANPGIADEFIQHISIHAFHPLDHRCLLLLVKDGKQVTEGYFSHVGFKEKLVWYNLESKKIEIVHAHEDDLPLAMFYYFPYICPSWAPSSLLFK